MAEAEAPARGRSGPPVEAIERALAGGSCRPSFQPIVDLSRRTVVGYEALSRFEPVEGRPFGPDEWFLAAHRAGLGPELDAVAVAAALAHRPDLPVNCFLTINVDPESLPTGPLAEVLSAQGSLGGLVIEITEHRRWDWAQLAPVVAALQARGALFAVDDAGSGYAGLQQILQLRPAILKLDRALVQGIDRDEAKVALVEMLGLFANRLDAWVLAEGVETPGEARRLAELEVPLAQGYHFGRPGPPWVSIDRRAQADLPTPLRHGRATLHQHVDPVAPLRDGEELAPGWLDRSDPWIAVVDPAGRPLGLLGGAARVGELQPAPMANVHSSPAEVADRLATAAGEPGRPVVVTDNAGRYLGLVSLRRLLSALSAQAGGHGGARP